MPKTRQEIRRRVLDRVHSSTLQLISEYVTKKKPALWGQKQGRGYLTACVLLALYKDTHAVGYDQLVKEVKPWMPVSSSTLRHNTKLIRTLLAHWGRKRVKLGSLGDWEKAARYLRVPKVIEGVCLWIDSIDLRKTGKASAKRSDPDWSHKVGGPAKRYMVLSDAKGRIRKVWGGYSPKLFDGHLLEAQKRWWEKRLRGAVVVGDGHFTWGRENLHQVTFHAPYPMPRKKKQSQKHSIPLTKKQRKYNIAVKTVRARVENTFGRMKAKFESLRKPWGESDTQLDNLVWLAAGICNVET